VPVSVPDVDPELIEPELEPVVPEFIELDDVPVRPELEVEPVVPEVIEPEEVRAHLARIATELATLYRR